MLQFSSQRSIAFTLLMSLVALRAAGQTTDPPPTGLWAAQTSPNEITLAWGQAATPVAATEVKSTTGAIQTRTTGYRVYREGPDGTRRSVAQLSGTATVAVVQVGLKEFGTAQQYSIEAVTSDKTSASRPAEAAPVRFNTVTPQQTTPNLAALVAPSAVTATQTGEAQITVTWAEVPGATAYRITRAVSPTGFQVFCQLCPTGSTIVDRAATSAGAKYTYTVAAYTPRGLSKNTTSNAVILTPKGILAGAEPPKDLRLEPRNVWAAQTSASQITLVWSAPDPIPTLKIGPVIEYRVYEESPDGRARLIATLGSTATRAVVPADGSKSGPKQFSIAAASATIKGLATEAVKFNVVTPATGGELPAVPTVTVSRTSGGQNTVTWTAVPGATAYSISRSMGNAGFQTLCGVCAPTTTFVDKDARVPTLYRYAVSAYSAGGRGRSGESALDLRQSTADPKGALKAPPTNAKGVATSPSSVMVTWTAAQGASGYRMMRSLNGGSFILLATLPATATSYQDSASNLLQQAPRYRIEAFDASGKVQPVAVTLDLKTAKP